MNSPSKPWVPSPRKTAGQEIFEHDLRRLALEDDVTEYSRIMLRDQEAKLYEVATKSAGEAIYAGKDFYIVMLTTTDRALKSPKTVILARRSCPTPVYKQVVYKYRRDSGLLEYLWTIPSSLLYHQIVGNPKKYVNDKECSRMAKFVLLMESGELLNWVKKENGEKKDAIIFTSPINAKEENA
jgi:hypothetical protein